MKDEKLKKVYLALKKAHAKIASLEDPRHEPMAIIGAGCRFPGGVDSLESFWKLLDGRGDAISEAPMDRWPGGELTNPDQSVPGKMYTSRGGFLRQSIGEFDASFFNLAPREARAMDPQQRLLLEVAWETVEDAGLVASELKGSKTGVFVGISGDDYALAHRHSGDFTKIDAYSITGTTPSTAAGRISYFFDWEGPCMALDTACSSSLVAIHLACQSLRSKESDFALAGGVNLILTPDSHVCFSKLQALSPDGQCRFCDASANGYVRGEGCGLVMLRRLSDAVASGDRILALIRGTAVNQDGKSNGLTAPNGLAQQRVIRRALADGQVQPSEVGYVEAHGTGTPLGDPIEMDALGEVLAQGRDPGDPLIVGSVKSNFGHLESAAGVAGLAKVILAFEHEVVPASLHFKQPNPHIDWERLPVRVPVEPLSWPRNERPRLAGLSSFGFSGTNAHLVLQEPPPIKREESGQPRPVHLLNLSARSKDALRQLAVEYARALTHLDAPPSFGNFCHTANTGRSSFEHRLSFAAATPAEAIEKLNGFHQEIPSAEVFSGEAPQGIESQVVFLFTGQGSQYAGMCRELYSEEPVFRQSFDECDRILLPYLKGSLVETVLGGKASDQIRQTLLAQPAIFSVEYSLYRLLESWGIMPAAVMGHSLGEYVASCVAGVINLEDALRLVATRARLMQDLPAGGGMAAVFASAKIVEPHLAHGGGVVEVAAYNGPENTVISGPIESLNHVLASLAQTKIKAVKLSVSNAFHSKLVEPMLPEFEKALRQIQFSAPQIPVISNLTGREVTNEFGTPDYWLRHVRSPVRFADGIETLRERGFSIFVELGPKPDLISMVRHYVSGDESALIPTLRQGLSDCRQVYQAVSAMWAKGCSFNAKAFDKKQGLRRISIPNYPFQRKKYWALETLTAGHSPRSAGYLRPHPLLDAVIHSPVAQTTLAECVLNPDALPLLRDHRVYGEVVVSGAYLVSALLGTAAKAFGWKPARISNVLFQRALVVPQNSAPTLQIALDHRHSNQNEIGFKVASVTSAVPDQTATHAAGTIGVCIDEDGRESEFNNIAASFAALETKTTPEAVYQSQLDRHIALGPGYRWLESVALGKDEAIGSLRVPDAVGHCADYQLHPGLIDSCFGLVVMAMAVEMEDAFVPYAFRELRYLQTPKAGRLWVRARCRRESQGRFLGDAWVADESGTPVMELRGLEGQKANRATLFKSQSENIDDWLYRIDWRREAGRGECPFSPQLVTDAVDSARSILDKLACGGEFQLHSGLMRDLDRLCAGYALNAIEELGWKFEPGQWFSTDDVLRNCGVDRKFGRLLHRLLVIMAEEGMLQGEGEKWRVIRILSSQDRLKFGGDESKLEVELPLVKRCGAALAKVLRGECDPLKELLFPAGDSSQIERVYRDTFASRTVNALVVQAVKLLVDHMPHDRELRILEIGAGTGGTTAAILPVLPVNRVNYVFTDVTPKFTVEARSRFAACSFMDFKRLDIEQSPLKQGFKTGDYDLVIAANVLHATKNMGETLAHARELLAPGGVLLLAEGLAPVRWLDLVFGLTEGWWRFTDTALRPAYPLLSFEQWNRLLKNSGFNSAEAVTLENGSNGTICQQALIVAQAGEEKAIPTRSLESMMVLVPAGPTLEEWRQYAGSRPGEIIIVTPGPVFSKKEHHEFTLDANNPEDFEKLFLSLGAENLFPEKILYLWSLGSITPPDGYPVWTEADDLTDATRWIWAGALHLAQAVTRSLRKTVPRVWFVTQGAVSVGGEPVDGIIGSPLWGFARAIDAEFPELQCSLLDVDPASEMTASLIALEADATSAERQIALRSGRRYASRLSRQLERNDRATNGSFPSQSEHAAVPRPDRSYLITGGTGGLGLLLARWLAERGAKRLVLSSRSGTAATAERINAIRALGCDIEIATGDVSNYEETARFVALANDGSRPLGGIIHCAGIVDNGSLAEQNARRMMEVMAPKVNGAWNLHRLTSRQDLDFFILFSSAASVLGAPGQSNYAAANAFLDALAAHRRANGLRATSINWSAWTETGVAARHGEKGMLKVRGVKGISSVAGLAAFERILVQDRPQIAVLPVDWPVYLAQGSPSPFFADFRKANPAPPQNVLRSIRDQVTEATSVRKGEIVLAYVAASVGQVLGLSAEDEIDRRRGFFEMGMDSLTSVELRNRLQRELNCTLPATLALDYPTVNSLGAYLSDKVFALGQGDEKLLSTSNVPAAAESRDLAGLTDEQAEDMLRKELAELTDLL